MRLSLLQKYILLVCFQKGGRIERSLFRQFYHKQKQKAQAKYQESIITNSIEKLIDRELLIGYGRRTPHKWFITHVKLTKKGAKISQKLLEEKQIKLPFK